MRKYIYELNEDGYITSIRTSNNIKDSDKTLELSDEEKQSIKFGRTKVVAGKPVLDESKELLYQASLEKNKLRLGRKSLLAAFDKYKSNVYYGIESETLAERDNIMAWYKAVLELDENALENVPAKIKYYV